MREDTVVEMFNLEDTNVIFPSKEVIGNIQANPGIFRMREDQEKLSLRSDQVNSVEEAYQIVLRLNNG